MASIDSPPPRLPEAPDQYSQDYLTSLVRALEVFINQERNPGQERATKITLTDLPTSDSGLEAGALYRNSNNVKISLIDLAAVDGLSSSSALGSVTVSIS